MGSVVKPFNINGKTKRITGRRERCLSPLKREGLGDLQESSGFNGIESIKTGYSDSSREDSFGTGIRYPNPSFGKILERLKRLENEYLRKIREQHQQLEALSKTVQLTEYSFGEDVKELEQEILALALQESHEHLAQSLEENIAALKE
jgi:gluconate kinase